MSARSVASGTLSFGLVAIPVKFYITSSPDNVHFNAITKDGNRVRQMWVDSVTGIEVGRDETQKGYEYAKGQYVLFTPEELKSLGDGDGGSAEIVEFVPVDSLDTMHVEKTYFLDAGKGGDKAYRLLVAALKKKQRLAVAQWTNRGRQHLLLVGVKDDMLIAYQMFYDNEVREHELKCAAYNPRDPEVDMACQLMDQLSNDEFDSSKYTNKYNERVLAAVERKRNGETVEASEPEAKPSGDLFATLMASIKKNEKAA